MAREIVNTPACAPTPPFFSQAVKVGNMVFVSGQLSRDAQGNIVGKGDMAAQTRQVLANVRAILQAAGGDLKDVVRVTAYMTDMSLAPQAWAIRAEAFKDNPPASTGVQVQRLTHPDFLIELEVTAVIER